MQRILAVGISERLGLPLQRLIPDMPDDLSVFETANLERALEVLEAGATFQSIVVCISSYDFRELANARQLRERHSDIMILALIDVDGDLTLARSTLRRLLVASCVPSPAGDVPGNELPPRANGEATNALTARQMDVLNLLKDGKSNKEIALTLSLAEDTVKVHCAAIFRKLGVTNRTQAAIAAERIDGLRGRAESL